MHDAEGVADHWRKGGPLNKGCWHSWLFIWKNMKLDAYLTPYPKSIPDLWKPQLWKKLKLLKEKIKYPYELGMRKDLLTYKKLNIIHPLGWQKRRSLKITSVGKDVNQREIKQTLLEGSVSWNNGNHFGKTIRHYPIKLNICTPV